MICQQCGTDNANSRTHCLKCGKQLRSDEVAGIVTCKNHGNRASFTICEQCLRPICEECTVVVGARTLCVDDAYIEDVDSEEILIEQLAVGDPAVVLHAGFGSRLAAGFIDACILLAIGGLWAGVYWLLRSSPPNIFASDRTDPESFCGFWSVFAILALAYTVLFVAAEGQTLGKQAMRIAVVEEDGTTPTLLTAFLRAVYTFVSLICIGMGIFAILKDDDKQAWHDRWAKTYVISLDEAAERL